MSRIFLSHSSADQAEALAVRDWLVNEGWNDLFLDLDPERGLVAGERWQEALKKATERCEAVLFLISPNWAASKWCLAEFLLAKSLNKQIFGVIVSSTPLDHLPTEMTTEWQLVDLTAGPRDEEFTVELVPDGGEKTVQFGPDGLLRLKTGLLKSGLDAQYFAWPPKSDPNRSPYRGLRALEQEDAGIFFGRDSKIVEALDRLRGLRDSFPPRLLVILGASGAGKSSFMRAGVLPRLARDDRHFVVLPVIRPERSVLSGETGLIASLEAGFQKYNLSSNRAEIRKAVEAGTEAVDGLLGELVDKAQSRLLEEVQGAKPPTVVLPVDQAEELYFAEGSQEARSFIRLLRDLASGDSPSVIAVATMRSDAYEHLQFDKDLGSLRQQTLGLPPMPIGSYAEVIKGPVRRLDGTKRSLDVREDLIEAVLRDVEEGDAKDALPLLAFTMERLYKEYGGDGDLRLEEYDALGRVKGSIEAAVERALEQPNEDPRVPKGRDARLALLRRGLIPSLIGIDPDMGKARRKVAKLSEIPEDARPLLQHLVDQRLLATDVSKETQEATIEPAHEALLRQWDLLRSWLDEDSGALASLEGVKRAALEWKDNDQSVDWLAHTAGRLESAETFAARDDLNHDFTPLDWDYLAAAHKQDTARRNQELEDARKLAEEERKVAARTRIGLIAASILAVVAFGIAYWGLDQANEAETARQIAVEQTTKAGRQAKIAREQKEIADQQTKQAEHRSVLLSIQLVKSLIAEGSIDQALAVLLQASRHFKNTDAPDEILIGFEKAISAAAKRKTYYYGKNAKIYHHGRNIYIEKNNIGELYKLTKNMNLDFYINIGEYTSFDATLGKKRLLVRRNDKKFEIMQPGTKARIINIEINLDYVTQIDISTITIDKNHVVFIYDLTFKKPNSKNESENYETQYYIYSYIKNRIKKLNLKSNFGIKMSFDNYGNKYLIQKHGGLDVAYKWDSPILIEEKIETIKDHNLEKALYRNSCLKQFDDKIINFDKALSKVEGIADYGNWCEIFGNNMIETRIAGTSAGPDRTDWFIASDADPIELKSMLGVLERQSGQSVSALNGNVTWSGGNYEDNVVAILHNRTLYIFDQETIHLKATYPYQPAHGWFLPGRKIAVSLPTVGQVVVHRYAEGEGEPSKEIEEEYKAGVASVVVRSPHLETCTGERIGKLENGTVISIEGSKVAICNSMRRQLIDLGNFDLFRGSVQLSMDSKFMLTAASDEVRVYDFDKIRANMPLADALIGSFANPKVSSAFFVGASNSVITSQGNNVVLRWDVDKESNKWKFSEIYRGDYTLNYAEPDQTGRRLLVQENRGSGMVSALIYSVEARDVFKSFVPEYKSLDVTFDDDGNVSIQRGSNNSSFKIMNLDQYATKAKEMISEFCGVQIYENLQESPCWPSSTNISK